MYNYIISAGFKLRLTVERHNNRGRCFKRRKLIYSSRGKVKPVSLSNL